MVSTIVEGWPSGQWQQTVNLPTYVYVGSNPTPSTTFIIIHVNQPLDVKITIRLAHSATDISSVAVLFSVYADSLDITLSYQGFDAELASLPGNYASPRGALLLAEIDGTICGCVAMRPTPDEGICEMKRLYVASNFRGLGIGQMLADAIIICAQQAGYTRIRLDTLPSMHHAIRLYEGLGFYRIEAYYDTPIAGTVFMEKQLAEAA